MLWAKQAPSALKPSLFFGTSASADRWDGREGHAVVLSDTRLLGEMLQACRHGIEGLKV